MGKCSMGKSSQDDPRQVTGPQRGSTAAASTLRARPNWIDAPVPFLALRLRQPRSVVVASSCPHKSAADEGVRAPLSYFFGFLKRSSRLLAGGWLVAGWFV